MEHESDLTAVRHGKLGIIRELGDDPFGGPFETAGAVGAVRASFAEGAPVAVAGRVTAHRNMGKSHFLDLSDFTGRIQAFVSTKEIGGAGARLLDALDIGDWAGVTGEFFTTKTGEPTIRAKTFRILAKSLRPLPEKWHGVHDAETKYRQRYLDLIANEESRAVFRKRFEIIRGIRRFLDARGFLEVETPMMQPVAGGAAARPFQTRHNALGMDLFLRIAPELYLKRLLVAGLPKVYELNRNFRNEGLSRRHNPEFTMLEAYQAFGDFSSMALLVEDLVCALAEDICGSLCIEHRNAAGEVTRTINLSRPWRRTPYNDLIEEAVPGWWALDPDARRARCGALGLDLSGCGEDFEVTQHVFEKLVEEKTLDPLFVTHCPKELVPLARLNAADPAVVDVFELIINGQEIAPGYSELNDPGLQRARLLEQSGGETQSIDEDFLRALEYGMPPAGGIGIGIDRLTMMLTGAESIRDVILFPHMRPRSGD
jgi:lysyl-tRNA synthetase, class II